MCRAASFSAPAVGRPRRLDAGLVSTVANCCALRDYASCRAVCRPWRAALPPPLSLPFAFHAGSDAAGQPVSLAAPFSLHSERWSWLLGLRQPATLSATACRCVGARDGWVALVGAGAGAGAGGDAMAGFAGPLLFNPVTGQEIPLDASLYEPEHEPAPKIALSPNPTPRDFTAVSLCRPQRLAVQRASGGGYPLCLTVDTRGLMGGAVLVDAACGDGGRVYCLARDGEVHVLCLSNRRRRGVRRRGARPSLPAVEVRPLLRQALGAAAAFPPPYDAISRLTDAKNLVLSGGVMYQVWRRRIGAGAATFTPPPAPGEPGRWVRVSEGDVFVLRYDPAARPPRWAAAAAGDLGGGAVLVGMNDAAVVRGHGVRANSVYYWDEPRVGAGGRHEAVVFDMKTRASVAPCGGRRRRRRRPEEARRAPCGSSSRPPASERERPRAQAWGPSLGSMRTMMRTRRRRSLLHTTSVVGPEANTKLCPVG
ncbi:hypothetical protein ACP4OV_011397 [Aristida adscensionis]